MSDIQVVSVESIDHNPFRNTGHYPFVTRKIEALKRSINDVGLWEGIIARKNGNRYELAFGHHRYEAARQLDMDVVDVIVRDLNDEQMLAFMGRENMEDYNADFLAMLETWEAAWTWAETSVEVSEVQAIEVARLLGWTKVRGPASGRQAGQDAMNETAGACNAARSLLADNHVDRADLVDLTVREAREICERAQANITRIDKAGKALGTPTKQITAAKKAVSQSVKTTAKQSREGSIAKKNLRSQVDVNAYKHAKSSKTKDTPLFAIFGKTLANGIAKILKNDSTADRLDEVAKAIGDIRFEEDHAIVRRLDFELGELSSRAGKYQRRLTMDKVVTFPLVTGDKA